MAPLGPNRQRTDESPPGPAGHLWFGAQKKQASGLNRRQPHRVEFGDNVGPPCGFLAFDGLQHLREEPVIVRALVRHGAEHARNQHRRGEGAMQIEGAKSCLFRGKKRPQTRPFAPLETLMRPSIRPICSVVSAHIAGPATKCGAPPTIWPRPDAHPGAAAFARPGLSSCRFRQPALERFRTVRPEKPMQQAQFLPTLRPAFAATIDVRAPHADPVVSPRKRPIAGLPVRSGAYDTLSGCIRALLWAHGSPAIRRLLCPILLLAYVARAQDRPECENVIWDRVRWIFGAPFLSARHAIFLIGLRLLDLCRSFEPAGHGTSIPCLSDYGSGG